MGLSLSTFHTSTRWSVEQVAIVELSCQSRSNTGAGGEEGRGEE